VPELIKCPHCEAPHQYIYFNDGKKKTQLICKVCKQTFKIHKRFKKNRKDIELYCPHCHYKLYEWKVQQLVTIYKCGNKKCSCREKNLQKLNPAERMMQKLIPTHFKLTYQYREYHFTQEQLEHSKPKNSKVNLFRIHSSDNLLGLILTLHISFAMSARKTALFLRMVFNVHISGQTVLNYAQAAAHYCHQFNLKNKGPIDDISVGDETYIKVKAKHHYVWFVISAKKRTITAYHISDNRGTQPAVVAMLEAKRTAHEKQQLIFITDGNPSYQAGLHFINNEYESDIENKLKHIKVIGLENLDEDSTEYRSFKQIIERLNRTFKQHHRPSAGFNTLDGAITLTTLFVTHYNFLRPHMALKYKVPVHLHELDGYNTIQEKWLKILSLAA